MSELQTMKPSQLAIALQTAYRRKRPMFAWGGPGVGKSDIMRQTADALGVALIDIRVLLLDPVDLRGLPSIICSECGRTVAECTCRHANRVTAWNTPAFLPRDGEGILFLDELNAAPPMIQAACYQLVLDRRIGEYVLPDGWVVFAAGNRESDGAVTSRMGTAIRSRFIHVELETNIHDWSTWAIKHDIEDVVIAFLRYRPELLSALDRDSKAFPCPRTWQFVSDLLKDGQADRDIEHKLIMGTVGQGAAVEFSGFLRTYRNLPNLDALLLNPDKEPVPNDPAVLYAIASALSKHMTAANCGRAIKYLDRMPAEFSVMSMKDALLRDKALHSCDAVTKWAVRNQDVIF